MVGDSRAYKESAARFFSHVLAAALCTTGSVFASYGNPRLGVVFAALLSFTAPLGPVIREALDTETGAPAPADLQHLSNEIAHRMRTTPVPLRVTVDQPGVAALRGLSKSSRRITVGEHELELPTRRLLAILAHELAHAKSRHQFKAIALSVLCWAIPQVVGASLLFLTPTSAASVAAAGSLSGFLTALAMLYFYRKMRQQEHEADRTASDHVGAWVREELKEHFLTETHLRHKNRAYDTHPTPVRRAEALRSEGI